MGRWPLQAKRMGCRRIEGNALDGALATCIAQNSSAAFIHMVDALRRPRGRAAAQAAETGLDLLPTWGPGSNGTASRLR